MISIQNQKKAGISILVLDMVNALIYMRKQQGSRQALETAWQFLREPFFERHDSYILRKSLEEPVIVPKADVELELRQIGLENLHLLKTIMPDLRIKRIAKKIQAGEICNSAIKDGKVIGFVLAGFEKTPSTSHAHLKLDQDEAYLWSGYTLPQYRRQKVVKVINLSLCWFLREKGYRRVLLLVEKTNQASLGHCFKMDYQITDQFHYSRVLNSTTCQISPFTDDAELLWTQVHG